MKLNSPKNKGNAFETKIMLKLREISPNTFRTMGSGNSQNDLGDVHFKDYIIECKHYKSVSHSMIYGKDGWWQKICKEASKDQKQPLLIYKLNNQPERVVLKLEHILDHNKFCLLNHLDDEPVEMLFTDFFKLVRRI